MYTNTPFSYGFHIKHACSQTGSATWLTAVLTHFQVKKYHNSWKSHIT